MSQLAPRKGNKTENPIGGMLEAVRHAAVFGILASNPDIKKPFGSWKAADNISFGQAALASQNYIEFARRDATSQINSQLAGSGRKMSGFSGKNSKLLNAWSGGMDLASWALRPDSYIPVVKGANTGIRIISPLTKGIKAVARPLSRGAKSISERFNPNVVSNKKYSKLEQSLEEVYRGYRLQTNYKNQVPLEESIRNLVSNPKFFPKDYKIYRASLGGKGSPYFSESKKMAEDFAGVDNPLVKSAVVRALINPKAKVATTKDIEKLISEGKGKYNKLLDKPADIAKKENYDAYLHDVLKGESELVALTQKALIYNRSDINKLTKNKTFAQRMLDGYKNSRFASDRGEADINPMNWLRRGAKLSEKDAARTEEVAALLRASNKEAGSDAFSGMPSTELGELTGALGGHSSAIPGVNGTYRDAFGQLHVVKGHTDSASAYAEARGSQLTRDLFGLETPDQKVIKLKHPITGDKMFGVRSTYNEKFAEPTGKFTDDEFYRQSVASILRRDKDLQAENLYGNIVADQGQAFVANKASQPRTVGGLRLPVGDQVRANFLMEKAGARSWFAETTADIAKRASKSEYSAGFQKAIDDALANFDSSMGNLGKLSPEEKAMYSSLKDDLIQLSKTNWAEVQAHHAQIVPKVAKPKTDAAIKKAAEAKEARKLQAQESIKSGMPEWLLSMRDTLSARKDAMKGMLGDDSGAASIDMLTGGLGKLISSIGKRIPRPGIENALDRGVMGSTFMDELSKTIQAKEFALKQTNGVWERPVLSDIESQVGSSSLSKIKKLGRRSSLGDKISSMFDSNGSTDMIRITSGSDEGQLMSIKDWEKLYYGLPEEARGYLPEVATVKANTATRTRRVTATGIDPMDRSVNATGEFLIRPVDVEAWMYAGNFNRSINPVRSAVRGKTKNSVSNNIMSIEQDFQGSGLATGLIRRQDSIFPRLGVDRNTVETAEAGTSVWGKMGFDLDRYDNAAGQMNRKNSSSSPQWLDNMETYGLDAEYPDLYASIQAFSDGRNPGLSIQDIMRNPESSTIFRGSGWYGEKVYPKAEPKKSLIERALQQQIDRQRAKSMASTTFSERYDQMARIARGEEKAPNPSLVERMLNGYKALQARMPNPNIPGLRSGGTINNDNTLANLHQGEMVLTQPLTQKLNDGINALSYMMASPNNSMSSISSGQPAQQVASAPVSYYNLTVQPSPGMDEDALANRVVRKLKDHERRVGMARR
jgi:hypothetical protein